ncbi:hypothetical protein EZV62_006141 [Acer yangbiense]|uniref:Transposase MuDR plant domain-containing protein n=1 Tax=Acer yangbiense TaxID=1000413 RepID=A0A5C7IRX0_9ROSI|nr:hypothetical protein EZV62_006141 [Acer yangbiense]
MGLDIFEIYVTIDTKVVELGTYDPDHISMIVMFEKREVCSDNDILEVFRFIGDIPYVAFSGFEQDLFGDNKGDLHYEGDNKDQVRLGDDSGDDESLGMRASDDESSSLTALAVVPEVPEEVCKDTYAYEDLFEGCQSKSDDEYCSDSGDEVSDAKLVRVANMAKGCPWRIHASNVGDDRTMQVKTYKSEHTCHRIYKSKDARSKWIAEKFQALMKGNPGIQASVISDLLRDQFNVVVDTQRLYKAKNRALEVLLKEHEGCFQHLRAYALMVQ